MVAKRRSAGGRSLTHAVNVLYIAGIGRSGSTLVERLLGEVPDVCSLGEVAHLWQRGIIRNELCGCGAAFHDCPFWTDVGRAAFGGWANVDADRMVALAREVDDVSRVPRLLRPGHGAFADDLREYVGAYEAVYRGAREVTGRRVVVDSSKYTSLAYCLRTSADLRVRVVHAVRDSRGVAYSWTKTVRRPETGADGADAYMPTFSPARVAILWSGHNLLVQAPRLLGTPVHLARYEHFVADPRAFLARLLDFAGVPVTGTTLAAAGEGWVELGVSHQVAGNPMRYQVGRIPVHGDDTWRQALPVRQRRLVTALTAPVALLLGYAPSTLWTAP
jgi:hypothetical protein